MITKDNTAKTYFINGTLKANIKGVAGQIASHEVWASKLPEDEFLRYIRSN
jgi:hypothetical protein